MTSVIYDIRVCGEIFLCRLTGHAVVYPAEWIHHMVLHLCEVDVLAGADVGLAYCSAAAGSGWFYEDTADVCQRRLISGGL